MVFEMVWMELGKISTIRLSKMVNNRTFLSFVMSLRKSAALIVLSSPQQ
jgi:hypothetical protein